MFKFFESVALFVTTVVNFVINFVEILIFILLSVVKAVSWLFVCIVSLPPFLVAFVIVPISIAVIFQVLNKGS